MTTSLQRESRMPSLSGATGWLNSEPLTPAQLRGRVVLIDVGTYTHGVGADAGGYGHLDEDRMYQLVRQPVAVEERTFEITFHGGGAEAYVFTFG